MAGYYNNYITREPVLKSAHPEIKAPKVSYRSDPQYPRHFSFDWMLVTEPFVMRMDPHVHEYDEYLYFLGGNPQDPDDFDAEIELSIGEECEKHVITEPVVVYLPKGLPHCPFIFKKVVKPFSYYNIFLSSEYSKADVATR
jgi:hypothetical protein